VVVVCIIIIWIKGAFALLLKFVNEELPLFLVRVSYSATHLICPIVHGN